MREAGVQANRAFGLYQQGSHVVHIEKRRDLTLATGRNAFGAHLFFLGAPDDHRDWPIALRRLPTAIQRASGQIFSGRLAQGINAALAGLRSFQLPFPGTMPKTGSVDGDG